MKRKLVEHYGLETHIIPEDGSDPDNEDFRVAFCNLSLTVKDGKPIQIPGLIIYLLVLLVLHIIKKSCYNMELRTYYAYLKLSK